MRCNEEKALKTAENVTKLLGIPHEYLKGSWMKVNGSVKPDEHIWYELDHPGNRWELLRQITILYCDPAYESNMRWGLHLSDSAFGWLAAKANETFAEAHD